MGRCGVSLSGGIEKPLHPFLVESPSFRAPLATLRLFERDLSSRVFVPYFIHPERIATRVPATEWTLRRQRSPTAAFYDHPCVASRKICGYTSISPRISLMREFRQSVNFVKRIIEKSALVHIHLKNVLCNEELNNV